MRRYLPLLFLIILGIIVAGGRLAQLRQRSAVKPASVQPQPLQPPHPAVQTAQDFLSLWAQQQYARLYPMLSSEMKKAVSEKDFAQMAQERQFSHPEIVAHVAVAQAAFVIARVQASPPSAGEKPLSGYALLLKKEGESWRIAHIQEQEAVAQKYEDMRLSPRKEGGWTIKYQDEKGQIITIELQLM